MGYTAVNSAMQPANRQAILPRYYVYARFLLVRSLGDETTLLSLKNCESQPQMSAIRMFRLIVLHV
jgi:hypothetical protein